MSKPTLIILGAILAVVILVIVGYLLYGKNTTSNRQALLNQQQQTASSPTPIPTNTAMKASLKSLMADGKTQTCQVSYPEQNGGGTIFVDGNKFSGNFTFTVEGKEMKSYIISDGKFVYMWSDGTPKGTKFSIESLQDFSPSPGNQSLDIDKEFDIKCLSWTADDSKFATPKDLEFSDMTKLMQQIQNATASGNPKSSSLKIDRSICDKLANPEAKEACIRATGGQ